ncbi:FERM domain-containing protein 8 isoform X3 [Phascolarctos cinereus]|uniref:FERM domain-containing protein 8 n=1 Tax=Phascolarctos cinereus TaxID=38626 RepID=A0A6P5IXX3_PHACI|nr:FERM domain-containing protein 8 isoform X2 [Phascolarctos cinereus]
MRTGPEAADVLVYLMDDTVVPLAVENVASITAQDLHRTIREALQLPDIAVEAFALWLISPLLEVQLKPKHQPYKVCRQWPDLLFRFTDAPEDDMAVDEPSLQFRRNVFFPKRKELQVNNEDILRLLYEEAKFNVLEVRYPCDVEDCEKLGALVCRLELGPYRQGQQMACAVKEKLDSFLPAHLCKRPHSLFTAFRSRGPQLVPGEQGLLSAYQEVKEEAEGPEAELLTRHYRAYLLKCHELPYYGCAFFCGEVDKPAQGFLHRGGRKAVTVAINLEGVHVIDTKEKHVLLGLRFQELSWDYTCSGDEEPILWLEFDGESEGTPVNRLLKVYSKQVAASAEGAEPRHSVAKPPAGPQQSPPPPARIGTQGLWLFARARLPLTGWHQPRSRRALEGSGQGYPELEGGLGFWGQEPSLAAVMSGAPLLGACSHVPRGKSGRARALGHLGAHSGSCLWSPGVLKGSGPAPRPSPASWLFCQLGGGSIRARGGSLGPMGDHFGLRQFGRFCEFFSLLS